MNTRIIHKVITFVFLIYFSATAIANPTKLTACGHPFYPPVSWINNNQLIGLAPHVAQKIFTEAGYDLELISDYNWKRCLLEAKLGNIDVIVAAYKISEREKYLYFSDQPLIEDPIRFFVNIENKKEITNINELKNKNIGLLLGDSFGEKIDSFFKKNTHIEYVSNNQQNFKKLSLKRIDYMPVGLTSGKLQSRKLGFHKEIDFLHYDVNTEFYYLAISKKNGFKKLIPYINQRLKEMKENNEITKLSIQYSDLYLNSP
jgi:polar amino acid transport system substrate-binding protein